jgi:hypothetical protein
MEWSEKMVHYSGYSEQDVMPYAVDIAGGCHDGWIVIRRLLRGQPPAGLSATWGLAILRAYMEFFSYQLVMLFLNMGCLTVASPAGLVVKLPNSKTNYVYTKYQSR